MRRMILALSLLLAPALAVTALEVANLDAAPAVQSDQGPQARCGRVRNAGDVAEGRHAETQAQGVESGVPVWSTEISPVPNVVPGDIESHREEESRQAPRQEERLRRAYWGHGESVDIGGLHEELTDCTSNPDWTPLRLGSVGDHGNTLILADWCEEHGYYRISEALRKSSMKEQPCEPMNSAITA